MCVQWLSLQAASLPWQELEQHNRAQQALCELAVSIFNLSLCASMIPLQLDSPASSCERHLFTRPWLLSTPFDETTWSFDKATCSCVMT